MRIVLALDELEDGEFCLGPCPKAAAIKELAFESCEEAFSHRVVVAVADGAARGADIHLSAALAEGESGVLTALIGVMNDISRPPLIVRHLERVEDQGRLQVRRHRPADNAAAEGVEHYGEIEKASPRRHVGDVGHPELVRGICREVALDEVTRFRLFRSAPRWCAQTVGKQCTSSVMVATYSARAASSAGGAGRSDSQRS